VVAEDDAIIQQFGPTAEEIGMPFQEVVNRRAGGLATWGLRRPGEQYPARDRDVTGDTKLRVDLDGDTRHRPTQIGAGSLQSRILGPDRCGAHEQQQAGDSDWHRTGQETDMNCKSAMMTVHARSMRTPA